MNKKQSTRIVLMIKISLDIPLRFHPTIEFIQISNIPKEPTSVNSTRFYYYCHCIYFN